jgi:hypothetical protein
MIKNNHAHENLIRIVRHRVALHHVPLLSAGRPQVSKWQDMRQIPVVQILVGITFLSVLGAHQTTYPMDIRVSFPRRQSDQSVKLTTHLYLVPWLKMTPYIPSQHVVYAQGQFWLYFIYHGCQKHRVVLLKFLIL